MSGIREAIFSALGETAGALGETAGELATQVVLQMSSETATGFIRNFTDLEEKYEYLNRRGQSLRALRADKEGEVQRCREKVTTSFYDSWINEASDVDEEVNALLTKYEDIRASNHFWQRPNLSSEMEQLIVTIKRLVKEGNEMVFLVDKPPERVLKVFNAPRIAGYPTLRGALEKLLELVKNSKIKAIGVHGLKGVGKTAILQNLNNHEEVAKLFDIVIFVSVPDDDEETYVEVQQKIARRLKVDTKGINDDAADIARKMHEELNNKKYLLILDGVVDLIDLTQLGIPNNDNYSKVVLAAQHQQGCAKNNAERLVKVDKLSHDEALKMFHDTIGSIIDQPGIREIAQRVCHECICLPLLIHKIAHSFKLKRSVESWRAAVKDLKVRRYENEDVNKLFSFLKFCYDELKDEKKQKCFLYTSLYPTDSKVYSDYLIECLAAQDFLGDINGKSKYQDVRDSGYATLEHLIDVSLLDTGKQMIYVSMNACMKQLASYISSKDPQHSSYVHTKEELERYESSKSWQNARWVSLIDSNLQTLPIDQDCSMLETLLLQKNPELSKIPPKFFSKHMRNLVVLDLYDTGIRSLPQTVSNLICLRGLYLNDCKHLTMLNCRLRSLARLEFLDIRGTKVSFLSSDIGYLTNLRCLRIPYVKSEDEAANGDYGVLSGLQKLEELIIEVVSYQEWGNDVANVMEQLASLENLTNLRCSFPTSNILENLLTRRSVKQFSSFRFFVGCQNSKPPSILECFEYKISKYLRYDNGGCEDTPAISVILPQIDALDLVNCNHIRDMSNLGTESLKHIHGILIEKCNEIHTILPGIVNGTRAESILPNLQQLHLINLPKLNCVFGGSLHEESLSKLRVLTLKDCSPLKYIFGDGAIQHFSKLHILKVQNCSDFRELIAAADSGSAVLPKLEELVLTNLPRLRSVCLDQALPWSSLEVLKVYKCSNLR